MTYAQLLSDSLDTIKRELTFRSLKGNRDDTLELAYLLLRHHCDEHRCFQHWWDYQRAPNPEFAEMLKDRAVNCTLKIMSAAAEIASEHG